MCAGAPMQPFVMIFDTAQDLAGLRVSDLERVEFMSPMGNRCGPTAVCCTIMHTRDVKTFKGY